MFNNNNNQRNSIFLYCPPNFIINNQRLQFDERMSQISGISAQNYFVKQESMINNDSGFEVTAENEKKLTSEHPKKLHSERKGHDASTCDVCEAAVADMLRVAPDFLKKPLNGFKEYSIFSSAFPSINENSKSVDFQFATLQTYKSNVIELKKKTKQAFSLNINLPKKGENGTSSKPIMENPIFEEPFKREFLNEGFDEMPAVRKIFRSIDIAHFLPNSHSTPIHNYDRVQPSKVNSRGNLRFKQWKKPVLIDPRLSARYDTVFPALNNSIKYVPEKEIMKQLNASLNLKKNFLPLEVSSIKMLNI